MAYPVIKIHSSGSDSAASGAGPTTALTGTAASTSADGLTVTLDGSPNLSSVAVDGSAVIYLNDSVAGNRNFGKITAANNTTKTVTVADAFGLSLTGKSWAIGGIRASIGSASSTKLTSNNSLSGDAMPGWILEMQSGHTETFTAAITLRRSGDQTDGPIWIRGAIGAATMPILTFNLNATCISFISTVKYIWMSDLEFQNSAGTKTSARVFVMGVGNTGCIFRRLRAINATNFWLNFFSVIAGNTIIEDCEVANTSGFGILSTNGGAIITRCYIHNCTLGGLSFTGAQAGPTVRECLIVNNTGPGINDARTSTGGAIYRQNTIANNGSDGITISHTIAQTGMFFSFIENNIIASNGGYGINFSAGSWTDQFINGSALIIRNNDVYNNTTNPTNPTTLTSASLSNHVNLDPQFVNTSGLDWGIGTNIRALADSLSNIGFTSTRSYVDIGAVQRQELDPLVRFNEGFN